MHLYLSIDVSELVKLSKDTNFLGRGPLHRNIVNIKAWSLPSLDSGLCKDKGDTIVSKIHFHRSQTVKVYVSWQKCFN